MGGMRCCVNRRITLVSKSFQSFQSLPRHGEPLRPISRCLSSEAKTKKSGSDIHLEQICLFAHSPSHCVRSKADDPMWLGQIRLRAVALPSKVGEFRRDTGLGPDPLEGESESLEPTSPATVTCQFPLIRVDQLAFLANTEYKESDEAIRVLTATQPTPPPFACV